MVVHGAGLDEVALHGETQALRVDHGRFEPILFTPEDAGLERAPLSALRAAAPRRMPSGSRRC
jgi:anthranilate phosphoribosyltransferase